MREGNGNGAVGADGVDAEVMRLARWKLADGGDIHAITPLESAIGIILVAGGETAVATHAQNSSAAVKTRTGRNFSLPLEGCFILSAGHDFRR